MTITAYLISGWHMSMKGYPFLKIFLDRRRILLIPEFALIEGEHYEAGEKDVVVRLRRCDFTTNLEQELWRDQVRRENEMMAGS